MRKKGQKRTVHLDQWIEIEEEGKCVVTRYPPNDELEELRLKMDPPAELIYRRMFFVTHVPFAYHSLLPENAKPEAGMYIQRILPEEWKEILAGERASGTDVIMLAQRPQARPEEFGPCPCPECRNEREKGLKSRYE